MKNEHLLPVNIIDLVEKFNTTTNENEKLNYRFRIEEIRDYCDQAVKKHLVSKFVDSNKNKSFRKK